MNKVQCHHNNKSDPYLSDILYDGMARFHRQIEPIDPSRYPPRYTRLIDTQNMIGWDQLYKGRWSIEWSKAQEGFIKRNHHIVGLTGGQSWVLSFGRLLMDQWLTVWSMRNEERHGKDKAHDAQVRTHRLHSELQELYSYKTKVCPADRDIFHESVETHLLQHPSLDAIETWIGTYKEAIKASTVQQAHLRIDRNRTLLEYPTFNPIVRAGT